MQIGYFYFRRLLMGVDSRCSCKGLFKKLDILPIPWEYAFSLFMFIIKNFYNFLNNTDLHGVNTRTKHQLHRSTVTLPCIKWDVFYSSNKLFNRLPTEIGKSKNETPRFRVALRKYCITLVFYFVDEFLSSSEAAILSECQEWYYHYRCWITMIIFLCLYILSSFKS